MKRLVPALAVVYACATMLYAQSPAAGAAPKAGVDKPKKMTMTGCVGTDTQAPRYVLEHAVRVGQATRRATEEAETIPTAYELLWAKRPSLEGSVGHMVEVTGTTVTKAATAAPSGPGQLTPQLGLIRFGGRISYAA